MKIGRSICILLLTLECSGSAGSWRSAPVRMPPRSGGVQGIGVSRSDEILRQPQETTFRFRYPHLDEATGLSMGMSGDFAIAAEEGATLVRVGGALFKDASALFSTTNGLSTDSERKE